MQSHFDPASNFTVHYEVITAKRIFKFILCDWCMSFLVPFTSMLLRSSICDDVLCLVWNCLVFADLENEDETPSDFFLRSLSGVRGLGSSV